MHLTGGILRHFRAFSTPEQNLGLGVLSTPAHPQVTPTVGRSLNVEVHKVIGDTSDVSGILSKVMPKAANRVAQHHDEI